MSTIFIRPFPSADNKSRHMVVVKPHPGGSVNRHDLASKKAALDYAGQLATQLGFEVVDQAK